MLGVKKMQNFLCDYLHNAMQSKVIKIRVFDKDFERCDFPIWHLSAYFLNNLNLHHIEIKIVLDDLFIIEIWHKSEDKKKLCEMAYQFNVGNINSKAILKYIAENRNEMDFSKIEKLEILNVIGCDKIA